MPALAVAVKSRLVGWNREQPDCGTGVRGTPCTTVNTQCVSMLTVENVWRIELQQSDRSDSLCLYFRFVRPIVER